MTKRGKTPDLQEDRNMKHMKRVRNIMMIACIATAALLGGCGNKEASVREKKTVLTDRITENGEGIVIDISALRKGEEMIGEASLIIPDTEEELRIYIESMSD